MLFYKNIQIKSFYEKRVFIINCIMLNSTIIFHAYVSVVLILMLPTAIMHKVIYIVVKELTLNVKL